MISSTICRFSPSVVLVAVLLLAPAAPVIAGAPAVDYLFPSGGKQGTTFKLEIGSKAGSKLSPWPAEAWIDCKGVEFVAEKTAGQFTVKIADDAPLGLHEVRIHNADGVSFPRLFEVGRHPELIEKEPNDELKAAQAVEKLPAVVNGRLEKSGDVDMFAVNLKPGKSLVAELLCRRLGAPCDPAIRLTDSNGVTVAFNHDTFGLDPLLAYEPPKEGRYYLQVFGFAYPPASEARFTGGKSTVYRLHLTDGPYVRAGLPNSLAPDQKSLIPIGWNLNGPRLADSSSIDLNEANCRLDGTYRTLLLPSIDNEPRFATAAMPGIAAPTKSDGTLNLPLCIDGRLTKSGAADRYSFDGKAKQTYTLTLQGPSCNSPIDPMVAVTDEKGTEIARDTGMAADIRLNFTAKRNGRLTVHVSDFKKGAGLEYLYRLEVDAQRSEYIARVDAPSYTLQNGKTTKVQVTVTMFGKPQSIKLEAVDLPAGVTADGPSLAKAGVATLTLKAADDALQVSQPFRIIVHDPSDKTQIATYEPAVDELTLPTQSPWLTVSKSALKPLEKSSK